MMISLIDFSLAVDVSAGKIAGINRNASVMTARHLYWKLLREQYGLTLEAIASMSGRHHSTVLAGIKSVNNDLDAGLSCATWMWNRVIDNMDDYEKNEV